MPQVLRSTHTTKHCGQVSLIRVGHMVHEIPYRQSILVCTFHEVVNTSGKLTHLLLPQEIENELTVLMNTCYFAYSLSEIGVK